MTQTPEFAVEDISRNELFALVEIKAKAHQQHLSPFLLSLIVIMHDLNPTLSETPVEFINNIPDNTSEFDFIQLMNTAVEMGFNTRQIKLHGSAPEKFPMLLVPKINDSEPVVVPLVLSEKAEGLILFDSKTAQSRIIEWHEIDSSKYSTYTFQAYDNAKNQFFLKNLKLNEQSWFSALLQRFKKIFMQFFGVTALLHLLSLAVPIYIMLVYDKVINTHAESTLWYLTIGIVIVLATELVLKFARSQALSWIGSRIDNIVNNCVFNKLMELPLNVVSGAPIASHLARIKSFTSLRDFFTGPIFMTTLELPFTLLMIAVIAILGGWIALIPIFALTFYGLLITIFYRATRVAINRSAEIYTEKQKNLVEIFDKLLLLRRVGLADYYLNLITKLSKRASRESIKSLYLTSVIDALSRALSFVAVTFTIFFGIYQIWAGAMSPGALIAAMFIMWRILSPAQSLCSTLSRFEKMRKAIRQINNFMMLQEDSSNSVNKEHVINLTGKIRFANIGFFYPRTKQIIIRNLSMSVNPGEMIVVTGNTGTGKSSLLNLINGIATPNIGTVYLDEKDLKQLQLRDVRKHITHMPQQPVIFSGSFADNLRIVAPFVTDAEIEFIFDKVDALREIQNFDQGIHTQITHHSLHARSKMLVYKINLARAFIKPSSLMLFDEIPNILMNTQCGVNLHEYLKGWHGKRTIFIVSQRNDILKMADKIILLEHLIKPIITTPHELFKPQPNTQREKMVKGDK